MTLDLHGVDVLVVGAGPIAARKVDGLSAAGAAVRVVAPSVSAAMQEHIDGGRVRTVEARPYRPGDLDGARLVVTATGDPEVDDAVAVDASARGVWVNAADRPSACSFILPAIARNGPLSVAVSTDGASPALARRLRDLAARSLTDDVVGLAARLAAERAAVRASGRSTEDVDWSAEIDAIVPPA